MKPIDAFASNQTRKDGSSIYRPTCKNCRTGIDGVVNQAIRSDGAKPEEPLTGAFWKCPICCKEHIVGVTVKVVLDHDHLSGYARDYICDSCNTGLGRFRNGTNFLNNAIDFIESFE